MKQKKEKKDQKYGIMKAEKINFAFWPKATVQRTALLKRLHSALSSLVKMFYCLLSLFMLSTSGFFVLSDKIIIF